MIRFPFSLVSIGVATILALTGCLADDDSEAGEHSVPSAVNERIGGSEAGEHSASSESNEHSGDSEEGEHNGGEGGEESGTQFALTDTFDQVRAGARLVLSFDSDANAFIGTVGNTTEAVLRRVRVEVHLSNGTELGPTRAVDLAPGQAINVTLQATDRPFFSWSAHPEVG